MIIILKKKSIVDLLVNAQRVFTDLSNYYVKITMFLSKGYSDSKKIRMDL